MSNQASRPRVVVLISGNGSNLQALLDADPRINITHVISNRKAAYGLERAKLNEIQTTVFALQPFLTKNPGKTRSDYDAALSQIVLDLAPDLIVLAGWMHIFSNTFLDPLVRPQDTSEETPSAPAKIPIVNLHPALPGQFDGINAIARARDAFEAGQIDHTGVMVHEVIGEVDKGRPILTERIDMVKGESLEALEERFHVVEHSLLVKAVQQLCDEMSRQ